MLQIPDWAVGYAVNAAVGSVAAYAMVKWQSWKPAIQGFDAIDKIEIRCGIKAPVWVHNIYHTIVTTGVNAIDKCVIDGPFLRNVIRAIIAKDPSKLPDVEKKFSDINLLGDIEAQIPQEYKAAFNQVKEDACVKTVTANMQKALPVEFVPAEDKVRALIQVGAAANKVKEEPVQATPELLEKIFEEHKQIIAGYREKLDAKK